MKMKNLTLYRINKKMANKTGSRRKKFEDLRVPMTMTVKPATRSLLDAWGESRGIIVDNLVEQENKRRGGK